MLKLIESIDATLSRPAAAPVCRDPDGECAFCAGRGWVRWNSGMSGHRHQTCLICDGVSTAGVYVVRTVLRVRGRDVLAEQSYQTADFKSAAARALRSARLLSRSSLPVVAVQVHYLGAHDLTGTGVVYSVPVAREGLAA